MYWCITTDNQTKCKKEDHKSKTLILKDSSVEEEEEEEGHTIILTVAWDLIKYDETAPQDAIILTVK